MNNQKTKNERSFHSEITVPITDYILTSLSCASLINEIFKNLLYQRSQIPYHYSWLKNIVMKKRLSHPEPAKRKNFTLEKHYRTVSAAYDTLEQLTGGISSTLTALEDKVKDVLIVFGVTPVTPKEVFTIKISSLAKGHLERNHVAENSKKHHRTLRNIFLSQSWVDLIDHQMPCTNVYILLRVNTSLDDISGLLSNSVFTPAKPLSVSPRTKHVCLNINYTNAKNCDCCDDLEIFEDTSQVKSLEKKVSIEVNNFCCIKNDEETWLQSKVSFQGFKDCFINKVAASDLW